jgi:hypothetical protein
MQGLGLLLVIVGGFLIVTTYTKSTGQVVKALFS